MMTSAGGETKTTNILDQKPSPDLKDDLENELHKIKEGKRSNGRKRWRLEEYLGGRQGKTAVYKASDTRLGYVALKFIAAHDEKVRRRFIREVAMLARVAHPNVVVCKRDEPLNLGKNSEIMVAILEYIPNKTVDLWIKQTGLLGEQVVITLAMDVLRGLEHIHNQGVIHKDIKCANILCGSKGFQIADFGISVMDESARSEVGETMNTTTEHKDPIGTPHYMSYEQHKRRQNLDFRTDLYSLGVVMYRCLSGKFPFGNQADVREDILEDIITTTPARVLNVSDQLSAIITKALQKQASNRYPSATDMLNDLVPLSKQSQPLPPGCEYHFYICKHEARAKESTMVIYYELRARGYKVWISNECKKPNEQEMIHGVKKSAVFLIFLTHGIFTRYWCRDVEIRTAMEERKPFMLLTCTHGDHKFSDHKQECSSTSTSHWFGLDTVVPIEFEPVANQLCTKITCREWSLNVTARPAILDYLEREFMGREKTANDFYQEASAVDTWLKSGGNGTGSGGSGGGGSSSRNNRTTNTTTNTTTSNTKTSTTVPRDHLIVSGETKTSSLSTPQYGHKEGETPVEGSKDVRNNVRGDDCFCSTRWREKIFLTFFLFISLFFG